MAAWVMAVAMVVSGVSPALAKKAPKETVEETVEETAPAPVEEPAAEPVQDPVEEASDAPQSCDALDPDATTTLAEVRQQIGADATGLTGAGVGVAVIDTGVNPVAGITVVDGTDLSFDAGDPDLVNRDLHGHGTSMASIVAADDGVAPGAHVVNVKVGAADGQTDVSQVIAALGWVVENRDAHDIRVVSLSFDTDASQSYLVDPLSRAVEDAWDAGIVVVAAGGNDGRALGRLGNPARDPFVIAVGAASFDRAGWSVPTWSSEGNGVRNPDLAAPGRAVLGAGVPGSYLAGHYPQATCLDAGGALKLRGSGTSQAAAVVAGAAALLLEQRPDLTPDQVKYLMTSTAESLGKKGEKKHGSGVLDVAAAAAAPTPGAKAVQDHERSSGLGSLEAARGTKHVKKAGKKLTGEVTAFGDTWDARQWRDAVRQVIDRVGRSELEALINEARERWRAIRSGQRWSRDEWRAAVRDFWSGATWSGATWSGATWSGATWSGATWSGATWSGATWSGATWSGATWA